MHDLLTQLRLHTPIALQRIVDCGQSLYVDLRHNGVSAGLVCQKTSPLEAQDFVLLQDGKPFETGGSTAAEQCQGIWRWMHAQAPAPAS